MANLKKGIYILPSFFTIGNLGCGFYSLFATFEGRFVSGAWAILAAIGFDIADGRLARFTKTTSKFGIEFDSMADLISFGLAPAFLVYHWTAFYHELASLPRALAHFERLGSVVAFLYLLAGAIRLARFNIRTEESETKYFIGLPIPAAAGILASFVIVYGIFSGETPGRTIPILAKRIELFSNFLLVFMIVLSYLMISRIRYTSFKMVKLSRPVPFRIFLLLVACGVLIWLYPQNMIFVIFLVYAVSGIIAGIWRTWRLKRWKHKQDHTRMNTNSPFIKGSHK